MPKERLLFLDFDGTICHDRFWQQLPKDIYTSIQKALFVDNAAIVDNWMRGKIDSHNICKFLAEKINADADFLYQSLHESCRNFLLINGLDEALNKLRPTYYIVLMTSNMDCFATTAAQLKLHEMFDKIINSSDLGFLKDEKGGRLFLESAAHYHMRLNACTLIDDSLRVCSLFQTLGGKALPVTEQANAITHLRALVNI